MGKEKRRTCGIIIPTVYAILEMLMIYLFLIIVNRIFFIISGESLPTIVLIAIGVVSGWVIVGKMTSVYARQKYRCRKIKSKFFI